MRIKTTNTHSHARRRRTSKKGCKKATHRPQADENNHRHGTQIPLNRLNIYRSPAIYCCSPCGPSMSAYCCDGRRIAVSQSLATGCVCVCVSMCVGMLFSSFYLSILRGVGIGLLPYERHSSGECTKSASTAQHNRAKYRENCGGGGSAVILKCLQLFGSYECMCACGSGWAISFLIPSPTPLLPTFGHLPFT